MFTSSTIVYKSRRVAGSITMLFVYCVPGGLAVVTYITGLKVTSTQKCTQD